PSNHRSMTSRAFRLRSSESKCQIRRQQAHPNNRNLRSVARRQRGFVRSSLLYSHMESISVFGSVEDSHMSSVNHSASVMASPLPKQRVHDPTASDMLPRRTAVGENGGVAAAGFFKGVCQDRQSVESTVVIDGGGEGCYGRSEPCRVDGSGQEG